MVVKKAYTQTVQYIKKDWSSNPWRLIGESYNWLASAITALIFAATVPNPPLATLYPIWISGMVVMIFCAYSRQSFGLLMLYATMLIIDTIGYIRLLLI